MRKGTKEGEASTAVGNALDEGTEGMVRRPREAPGGTPEICGQEIVPHWQRAPMGTLKDLGPPPNGSEKGQAERKTSSDGTKRKETTGVRSEGPHSGPSSRIRGCGPQR